MLCVDCLYIYFPLISQIIIGVYFPLISQINTDLNNIPFLYTFHHYLCPSVPSVGVISPSFTPYTLRLTPLSVFIRVIRGSYNPFHQKHYPCGTIRTISDKGTIFRAHMQGVGYKNTKFCCFSPKCLHMCIFFCTFAAEIYGW